MSIPGSGSPLLLASTAAAAAAEYVIPKSLRFNSGDNAHLDKTFASEGNRRTWTWSGWLKRSKFDQYSYFFTARSASTNYFVFNFTDDHLKWYNRPSSGTHRYATTTAVFRDPAAWYHVVLAWDTTESTDSDRVKLYVNGERITSFSASVWPAQNEEGVVNDDHHHEIGAYDSGTQYQYNGLMADVQFVDGQALAPTDFGETRSSDGVWVPKDYTGEYNELVDQSQNWTNLVTFNSGSWNGDGTNPFDADPTNNDYGTATRSSGGYATLDLSSLTGTRVISVTTEQTELTLTHAGGTTTYTPPDTNRRTHTFDAVTNPTALKFDGKNSDSLFVLISVSVDGKRLVNSNITIPNNGFHLNFSDSSTNEALGFDSAPTTPDPDPKKGMDVITYTGNGGTQNIGGLGFEPDFVWIKNRDDSSAGEHRLFDIVRGATNALYSNLTNSESAESASLTTFNPDGFTVGSGNYVNGSSDNMVAWCWKAGGAAVSNTDGSITSSVSANTTYGFSIVSYTSSSSATQTVGHGLGSAPKMIFFKDRDAGTNWFVHHNDGSSGRMFEGLNTTAAGTTNLAAMNNTLPSSSVFSLNSGGYSINPSGNRAIIAYCWSEVSEFSKFGSYSGTGAAGVSVTTGFKPKWVMIKEATNANHWYIYDTERGGTNILWASSSNSESQVGSGDGSNQNAIEVSDTGFSIPHTLSGTNRNGGTFVYAAFADRPGNHFDVNNIVTNEGLTTSKTQFDVVTYTGTGSSQSLSLSFQPDLIWSKTRSHAVDHKLVDSVRGLSNVLEPNQNRADSTGITTGITGTSATGFTVGTSSDFNTSGRTYVAWCWKAGGTAVSNTDGSITSSVSANAAYGFSIVEYTGTSASSNTIGHGLGSVPQFIIVKSTSDADDWFCYHSGIDATSPEDYDIKLNSTDARRDFVSWNDTKPTSSVFSVGNTGATNENGRDYIAYCFANVPGYQRFGSVDTGSDPVVITGFKPRFLLTKKTSGSEHWFLHDSERDPDDDDNTTTFEANNSGAEESGTNRKVKFLDNGFQLIGADVDVSGATSIYWAIGDDEIGLDEDCLVDVPNAVTADADATDTTGGYQRGNYCTMNPLDSTIGSNLTNGNLDAAGSSNWSAGHARGTIGLTSGKWFWEVTRTGGSGGTAQIGFANRAASLTETYGTLPANSWTFFFNNGTEILRPSGGGASYFSGSAMGVGDTAGIALDMDNKTAVFYKNGTAGATIDLSATSTGSTDNIDELFPWVGVYNSNVSANFGQMRFKYPIPSGYAALNTTAMPAATIEDGSTAFGVVTYTGDGNSPRDITGFNFSPDLVWYKQRNSVRDHQWYDSVRGSGTNKSLASNTTYAENANDDELYGYLSAFNSDGFEVTTGSTNDNYNNNSGSTYVAWAWDAGSSTVSNTDGSITSSVRANQSAGFSIVTYSAGDQAGTVGHGLNAAPEFIIAKGRNANLGWKIYHSALGRGGFLEFDTDAFYSFSNYWGSSITNSTFGISAGGDIALNNMVAYCFAPVAGYSAIGSYEGNSASGYPDADGPFVYTGMRPAFVMLKDADASESWVIYDTARNTFNVLDDQLYPNSYNAEASGDNREIDVYSNGFKIRSNGGFVNTSGNTYIYYAVAENPFQANGGLAR